MDKNKTSSTHIYIFFLMTSLLIYDKFICFYSVIYSITYKILVAFWLVKNLLTFLFNLLKYGQIFYSLGNKTNLITSQKGKVKTWMNICFQIVHNKSYI